MTTILVTVGDLHINSTVGLLKPTVTLDDGGTYTVSKEQRTVWNNWCAFWMEVEAVAKRHKAKVWTVFNGDMVDTYVKHETVALVTRNEADVIGMAYDTIEPALDVSNKVFVTRGTAAHVKHGATMEETIAEDINAEQDGDNYSWWELNLDCENVLFDIAHHGRLGGMDWTKANSLNKLVAQLIIYYRNGKIPDVAIRSHMHQYARSDDSLGMTAFGLPAWQLKTEFVHRLAKVGDADIGGMYFICDKGNYTPVVKRYPQKAKRAWRS